MKRLGRLGKKEVKRKTRGARSGPDKGVRPCTTWEGNTNCFGTRWKSRDETSVKETLSGSTVGGGGDY